jgi:precorrin-4/cobalt-precorrin-4 C11-methyltransferase
LADIADAVEEAGLRQAAVILVGHALAERIPADEHRAESYLYAASRDRSQKAARP